MSLDKSQVFEIGHDKNKLHFSHVGILLPILHLFLCFHLSHDGRSLGQMRAKSNPNPQM